MNYMKLWASTALALVAMAGGASAQEAVRLTIAAGHPPPFLWVKHLKESFMATVDSELAKTNKYKVTWNEAFGGTLAKIGSELETMEQGISDVGIVSTVFHSAKMTLNNYNYFVPFGPGDANVVSKANAEVQKHPALVKEWERYSLKFLGGFAIDNYNIMSTQPITKVEDLNGKKISGAGPNLNWIKNTGAVGVVGSLNDWYNGIKTGVYDGGMIFPTALIPGKFYEVAPHYNVMDLGAMYAGSLAINKPRYDKLPAEVRQAVDKGAEAYGVNFLKEQTDRVQASYEAWEKNGGKVHRMSAEERAKLVKLVPNPAADWVKANQDKGLPAKEVLTRYMDEVRKTGYKFVRDWDKELN
jgi:TRAP-type transport system periplasmic protein